MSSNKKQRLKNIQAEKDKINVQQIKADISIAKNEDNAYQEFCSQYTGYNFKIYNVEKLRNIYEIGNGLLEQYFIVEDKKCNESILIQLQYILSQITYCIFEKQSEELKKQNLSLNKSLNKATSNAEKLQKEAKNTTQQVKEVKEEQKNIIVTIISIVLTISIIPTAIAGIQNINGNYVLPFLSSIVLFGIIMISFVYTIYSERFKKRMIVFLTISIIITGLLWYMSFNFDICLTPKNDTDNENVQINKDKTI